jgi:hypothetical protein
MATVALTSFSKSLFNTHYFPKAVQPVIIDLIFYTCCTWVTSPQKALAASTLAGTLSVIYLSSRTKAELGIAAAVYIAFKTAHFFYTQLTLKRTETGRPPKTVEQLVKELEKRVTFSFSGTLDLAHRAKQYDIVQEIYKHPDFTPEILFEKSRGIWKSPGISQKALILMEVVAMKMTTLMTDLKSVTENITDPAEQNKQIALLLGNEPYLSRLFPRDSRSFMTLYWFIRHMGCIVHCTNHHPVTLTHRLPEEEEKLFSVEESDWNKCKNLYNKIIDLYTPLFPYLPVTLTEAMIRDNS